MMTYKEVQKALYKLVAECAKSRLSVEELRSIISEILDEMAQLEEGEENKERTDKERTEK